MHASHTLPVVEPLEIRKLLTHRANKFEEMEPFETVYRPLINFDQQVKYLTDKQRMYEAMLYGVELEEGQTTSSAEFMAKLQARIAISNDPLTIPFVGDAEQISAELTTIKRQVAEVERIAGRAEKFQNAEGFGRYIGVTLNACVHLSLRWNILDLLEIARNIRASGRVESRMADDTSRAIK